MSNLSLDKITKILENQRNKIVNTDDIPQIEKEKFQRQVNKALAEMSIKLNDKNDVSEKLKEMDISIINEDGSHRNFIDILQDVSIKFKECY